MKLISTKFQGLKVVQSQNFNDPRGFFKEDFKQFYFKNINHTLASGLLPLSFLGPFVWS